MSATPQQIQRPSYDASPTRGGYRLGAATLFCVDVAAGMGDEQLAPAYGAASRVTIGRPPEKTNDEAASLESLGCAQEILNPEESPGVAWLYTNNGTPLSRHRPALRCAVPFRFLPLNADVLARGESATSITPKHQ